MQTTESDRLQSEVCRLAKPSRSGTAVALSPLFRLGGPVKILRLTVLALAVVIPVTAAANPISIFNTGVDASHALATEGLVDLHWTITSGTLAFPGPQAFIADDNSGFPFPPWMANGPASQWIAPGLDANNGTNLEYGFGALYTYRTTFDLTGLDPLTASLGG